MEEASVTTVQIFGREYKIRGHADQNYIRKMAKYVDGKMRELAENSSLPSQESIAILVALNIADELFQERAKSTDTLSEVEERADHLIELLDQSLLAEK